METDALRWFQQVADGTTLTEVAEAEHITQSGLSRALARLENEIGTPLLRRSGRTLRLTRAGAAFKDHVDAMMHRLDDGLAAVEEIVDPDRGTVALAYQLSLGTWLIPRLIAGFRAANPLVRFELHQVRDELLSTVMASAQVDLEISTLRPADPGFEWQHLALEPLRLAVPAAHPLAGRTEVDLTEAAAEPFVTLRPGTRLRTLTFDLCDSVGFRPEVAFEGDDLPTVEGFVAAGLGVAVVPTVHTGAPDLTTGAVRHLTITRPHAVREIGLVWSTERRLLPAAQRFRAYVLGQARAGLPPVLARPGG